MSETTNLKLKKHDNVATNENPMNLEDYLNENWDIIDETFGTANNVIKDLQINVEDLNSENDKQNEDIETLKTDNDTNKENIETNASNIEKNTKDIELNTENIQTNTEDINTLKAQKEALEKEVNSLREDNRLNTLTEDNEGELVHIDNSTGARFNSLEIEGNEKQDTREGYNLVNPLAKKNVGNNGVTVDFKEDGSIVFNGTSNGLGAWLISDDINYEPGEKYTMIVDIIKGTVINSKFGWGILIYPYVAENAIKILDTSSGRITNSFTFPNDTEISQKNIYLWYLLLMVL